MQVKDSCIYNYIQPYINDLEIKKYKKGQCVLLSDEAFEEIFFILEGSVTVQCLTHRGKNFLVDKLYENDFVGKISYIFEENLSCDIIATSDVKLLCIDKELFEKLKEDSNFTNMFFSKTSKRIYYIYKKLLLKDLFKLEEILAWHINKNLENGVFKFKSMYQLSKDLTVSRKNLYNAMNKFIKLEYISKNENVVIIKNKEKLNQLAKSVEEFY